jgi:hypothetical protein
LAAADLEALVFELLPARLLLAEVRVEEAALLTSRFLLLNFQTLKLIQLVARKPDRLRTAVTGLSAITQPLRSMR